MQPRIAICVATYRRPVYLGDLLRSIGSADLVPHDVVLIIADNDVDGGAQSVVDAHRDALPLPIIYLIEKNKGLANVRNRLVAEARAIDADFIAFVDDDQVVDPTWLTALMTTQHATDADVVWGIAPPLYDDDVPQYIRDTGYFDPRPIPYDGAPASEFATCNVLIKLAVIATYVEPFDTTRNFIGGEDTKLARDMKRMGARIVRTPESKAFEHIDSSRGNASWIKRRRFREGYLHSLEARENHEGPVGYARVLAFAAAMLAKHALLLIPRTFRMGRSGVIKSTAGAASSLGVVAGLLGRTHEEYRITVGK